MSWQSGDVSPDARRAAEAAAEAAGVSLKDWFTEAVRVAIIRELGSVPAEASETESAAQAPEPVEPAPAPPPSEPLVPPGTAKADCAPEPEVPPESFVLEPAAAAEPPAPPPLIQPEPAAPEPIAAVEPLPLAEPNAVEPGATAKPPTSATVVGPAPPTVAKPDYRPKRVSFGVQRQADSALSAWLATRIQGLPVGAGAAAQTAAARSPTSAPPSTPSARSNSLADPFAASPAPVQRTPQPPQPAAVPTVPPPATPASRSAVGAVPQEMVPPLLLPAGPVTTVSLESLRPARIRARRPSDMDTAIAALAESVASQGVREPILVRGLGETAHQYEVVAGERRRLAAERAGRADLPAVIVEADDAETLILSLAENLGRGDFSPLDEARAYLRLLTEYRASPAALAERVARERSHIARALRLLGLPSRVRDLIDSGRLAPVHAYALLGAPDPEARAEQLIATADGVQPSSD